VYYQQRWVLSCGLLNPGLVGEKRRRNRAGHYKVNPERMCWGGLVFDDPLEHRVSGESVVGL